MYDFSPYAGVLLDLDGTLYHDEHVLPGAVELIARLQREGRAFACLSNTTTSPARVVTALAEMGIRIDEAHVYTAAAACVDYVRERWAPRPRVFNLATVGVHEMLDGHVQLVQGPDEACDAVLCGNLNSEYCTADRLRIGLELLRTGATLVGASPDRVYPSPRGLEFGVGAVTAMLAYGANVTPVFTGKPQALFFQKLCDRLGVPPARCVLVGDNLETDIQGARGIGMRTILTLTGITQRKHLANLAEKLLPDEVVEDLRALV